MWESPSQNQPFIDGNKRTAFAASYTFLVINGAQLTTGLDETLKFLSGFMRLGHSASSGSMSGCNTSVVISAA
ncbi:MAG: hypothetical protein WB610_06350 [Rhodomicrobium sp.]